MVGVPCSVYVVFPLNNKVERISLEQLYTTKELGGLGLVNVQVKCRVLLAKTGYGLKYIPTYTYTHIYIYIYIYN